MTAKEALLELVAEMCEEDAAQLLDYLNLRHDPDELSAGEIEAVKRSRDAAARGETMSLAELRAFLAV